MGLRTFEFSKAFIDKIGIGEFCKARNRNFLKTIFMYMTDWRTRKLVNLQWKMKRELKNIKEAYWDNVGALSKTLTSECSISPLEDGYYDQIMYDIQRWVMKNIKYKRDIDQHKTPEYWQSSHGTLLLKSGDCEDMSWLVVVLARLCDVPEDMVWLEAGDVVDPSNYGETAGHAWVKCICQFDGVPRIVDCCYFPVRKAIRNRLFANENHAYVNVWFGVNDGRYFGKYKSREE